MYILADIKRSCRKSRFIQEQTTYEKILNFFFCIFNKKYFTFYKYICKMYILEDIK